MSNGYIFVCKNYDNDLRFITHMHGGNRGFARLVGALNGYVCGRVDGICGVPAELWEYEKFRAESDEYRVWGRWYRRSLYIDQIVAQWRVEATVGEILGREPPLRLVPRPGRPKNDPLDVHVDAAAKRVETSLAVLQTVDDDLPVD